MSAATLTACASDASGAVALAERYVALVATADADDLEPLWAASAADPTVARTAGQLLLEATERIEVLEVGEASPADESITAYGIGSDVVSWEAVRVPVRYALGGEEHDGVVVLAPLEDAPRGLESSWRVVAPLMGELQVSATGVTSIGPDVFVAGTRLELDSASSGAAVPLYPGVYEVQLRGEPYLESDVAAVTVVAGEAAPLPSLALGATDETATALQASSDARFALCAEEQIECPFDISDLAIELEVPYPWEAELTTAPTVTLGEGSSVTLEGGALLVQGVDGPLTFTFSGTGPWFIDNQSWQPSLSYTELDLTVDVA